MSEIKIVQLKDKQGQKISPYTPASAVYVNVNGEFTNAESFFGGLNMSALTESYSAATDAINAQCEDSVDQIQREGNSYKDAIEVLQAEVERLMKKEFPFSVYISLSDENLQTMKRVCSYTVTNVPEGVTVNIKVTQNGQEIINHNKTSTTGTITGSKSGVDINWGNETFSVTATAGSLSASAATSRHLYISCAGGSTITPSVLSGGTKTLTSATEYETSVTTQLGQYIWIAVPANYKINKITSGGFEVTLRGWTDSYNIGGASYTVYRNDKDLRAGTWPLSIELGNA